MKKKRKLKIKYLSNAKIKSIFLKIMYVVISICILYNIVFVINTTITKKNYLSIFGISIFSMEDNIMKPDISKNELIVTKNVRQEELKVNDIIAYRVNDCIRINKIISINSNDGKIVYGTKSNQNYYPDIEKISQKQIIGKMIVHISGLGFLVNLLQSKIFTLLAMIVLILKVFYNKYAYQRLKERRRKKIHVK